jgi:hypothetical protein
VRGRTYGSPVITILKVIWAAADYPWSVRWKALLPEGMPWIRRRFQLRPEIEQQWLRISARSIDYRVREEKRQQQRQLYGRTKPGTLLKHHIPLKTDHWDVEVPGFNNFKSEGTLCPSKPSIGCEASSAANSFGPRTPPTIRHGLQCHDR